MADIKTETASWQTYRSRYRVKAKVIEPPAGSAAGQPVIVTLADGTKLPGQLGQALVELPGGKLEWWDVSQLEREMELEAISPRPLEVAVGR